MVYENAEHGTSHLPQYCRSCENVGDLSSLSSWTSEQFDPRLSWDDVARIKDLWGGKLIIKALWSLKMRKRQRKAARTHWSFPIMVAVSLTIPCPPLKALPDVVSAVGSDIEVWMDSGIPQRSGYFEGLGFRSERYDDWSGVLHGLGAYEEGRRNPCAGNPV